MPDPSFEKENTDLILTNAMKEDMRTTARWTMAMSIVGLAFCTFAAVGLLFAFFMGYATLRDGASHSDSMLLLLLILLVVVATLFFYFFLFLTLYRYSHSLNNYALHHTQTDLDAFSKHQKRFWQLVGVATIATLILNILGWA